MDGKRDFEQHAKFFHEEKRKKIIQMALLRLKRKNEGYLQSLESNSKWRKIYNGLLFNNAHSELKTLVKLQLCDANDREESALFNPFQKVPITMCYNKINQRESFQKQALYNLVLLYDSRTKKDMNWNKLEETAKSTVRALHISGICERNDRQCFQKQIGKRVLQRQRFKGKELNFEDVYKEGIENMIPISQIMSV